MHSIRQYEVGQQISALDRNCLRLSRLHAVASPNFARRPPSGLKSTRASSRWQRVRTFLTMLPDRHVMSTGWNGKCRKWLCRRSNVPDGDSAGTSPSADPEPGPALPARIPVVEVGDWRAGRTWQLGLDQAPSARAVEWRWACQGHAVAHCPGNHVSSSPRK